MRAKKTVANTKPQTSELVEAIKMLASEKSISEEMLFSTVEDALKKDRDFERALGMEVELRLFKAVDGQKEFSGELVGYDKDNVTLLIGGEEKTFARKAASLIKPIVDMDGVQDVDMGDSGEDMNVGDELEIEEE